VNAKKRLNGTPSFASEGLCKVIENYVKKGSKIYIEGALQTRKWQDQSGADRYSTEVVLQGFNCTLTLLDGPKGDRQAQQPSGGGSDTPAPASGKTDYRDEIPF